MSAAKKQGTLKLQKEQAALAVQAPKDQEGGETAAAAEVAAASTSGTVVVPASAGVPWGAAADADQPTLVEQHGSAAKKVPARRRVQRRDSEEAADRAIQEHYPTFTRMQTDVVRIDGLTLRERVVAQKRLCKAQHSRLGSTFWTELRSKYSVEDEGADVAALKVEDKTQEVSAELLSALRTAQTPNSTTRSRGPLVAWMASTTGINQKEMVGLVRFIQPIRPSVSASSLQVVIEFMRCITRLKLEKQFEREINHNVDTMDEALVSALAMMRRGRVPLDVFWRSYGSIAGLVLPSARVDTLMAAKGEWCTISRDLSLVVRSSRVGENMFGWAQQQVTAEIAARLCKEGLQAMSAVALTPKMLSDFQFNTLTMIETELGSMTTLNRKREIKVSYRGFDVPLTVANAAEEVHLRSTAWLKSMTPTCIGTIVR